jgi:replicative DNA helicase
MYDRSRYFAVTGFRLQGPAEPQDRQPQLDELTAKYFPPEHAPAQNFYAPAAVTERARKYLAKLPPAVSGSGGHNATFHAACVLVLGFGLDGSEALPILNEWNQLCQPPWSEKDLRHKLADAAKQSGERNYLRNVTPDRWDAVNVPTYKAPAPKPEPRVMTLTGAAGQFLDVLKSGRESLIDTGIAGGEFDYAIGGGVEPGEMLIVAALSGHGKSAVGLQFAHWRTSQGMPGIIISEEMGALAIGKRALQFLSEIHQEHWRTSIDQVGQELTSYRASHAECILVESCRTVDAACEQIEKAVTEHDAKFAIVDYAQLLQSTGRTRYEQVSNTSTALRQLATRTGIVLFLLAQLNRELVKRGGAFVPQTSDLRDSGQLEQDADVLAFCVWPHRLDDKRDPNEYQIFVRKCRNRPINQTFLQVQFNPCRQMVLPPKVERWQPSVPAQLWDPVKE